jgi:hypothetical protein
MAVAKAGCETEQALSKKMIVAQGGITEIDLKSSKTKKAVVKNDGFQLKTEAVYARVFVKP